MRRRPLAALGAVALGLLLATNPVAPPLGLAGAESPAMNRAAVVVDLGDGTPIKSVCVRFAESSISGKELLERAKLDAVFSTFSGEGSAVCALCGKGCPGDGSCLTCQQPDYWAYHRAAAGTSGWSYARSGPSRTTVSDGDVDGWRWGTGSAPPFRTINQVCGGDAPAGSAGATTTTRPRTTTTEARPSDGASSPGDAPPADGRTDSPGGSSVIIGPDDRSGSGATVGPSNGLRRRPSPDSPSGDSGVEAGGQPNEPRPGSSTSGADRSDAPGPAGAADPTERSALAATRSDGANGNASGPSSLVGFAAAMALIGGLIIRARRARVVIAGD